jgi:hypothetical protein
MKLRSLAAALGVSVLVFSANTAFAIDEPADPPAEAVSAGPDLVTVFGTGITLSIGTDAAGHLTTVELTSDAGPVDAVATEVSPHEVKFVIGDGSTQIEVEAKGTSVKTEVEASALADLIGSHTWSGELFGVGGAETTIVFEIGESGGVPTITIVSVSGPGLPSAIPPVTVSSDDDESEAKLRIELSDESGHQAGVTIKVEVENGDDHAGAELTISARSELFAVEEAVGPVADPSVNVPVSEQARDDRDDDRDEDHDSDHHEDEAHEDDHGDDHEDERDDERDDDHEDHEDERDDDHEDDHREQRGEGHERSDHDDDD